MVVEVVVVVIVEVFAVVVVVVVIVEVFAVVMVVVVVVVMSVGETEPLLTEENKKNKAT